MSYERIFVYVLDAACAAGGNDEELRHFHLGEESKRRGLSQWYELGGRKKLGRDPRIRPTISTARAFHLLSS